MTFFRIDLMPSPMLRTLPLRSTMVRIQFPTGRDGVRGKSVLVAQSAVQQPRSPIFKISKAALKLLDERHIPY
jgi:hypothetical protein